MNPSVITLHASDVFSLGLKYQFSKYKVFDTDTANTTMMMRNSDNSTVTEVPGDCRFYWCRDEGVQQTKTKTRQL